MDNELDDESALSLERALADLEMIQAAYPDEITTDDENRNQFPFRFTLHLSEQASVTMELQVGYPTLTGVYVSDYRTTKPTDKARMDEVVQSVRNTSMECLAENMEGSMSCCAAALETWNSNHYRPGNQVVHQSAQQPISILEERPSEPSTHYNWISGDPLIDKKSAFQAHLCSIHNEQQVQEALHQLITGSSKIQRATHNMYAWRIVETSDCGRTLVRHDNNDDGEDAAGSKLAYLLEMRKDENVLVVVSRWFGGIQLGPKRFAHIVNVARELLTANPQLLPITTTSKTTPVNNKQKNDFKQCFELSTEQIQEYLENGVLVVENVLTMAEVEQAKSEFLQSLRSRGVYSFHEQDEDSARAFDRLSSTKGSGGVLDIFYDAWKLFAVATHPKLFAITTEIWKAAYDRKGHEHKESLPIDQRFQWHPYGDDVDFDKGYAYIDRVGYRLPDDLSRAWGDHIHPNQKKKKPRPIQRSLTPHLDCCPDTFFAERATKWRPVQCFVSLTDNTQPNTGGFEAAPGFHRIFDAWAAQRQSTSTSQSNADDSMVGSLCVGEYTHIRPREDEGVMKQVRHIPVKAGSAVFWDNRIPHANSYRNDSDQARMVVYASFLPDIVLNRNYIQKQLEAWKLGHPIRDQWNNIDNPNVEEKKHWSLKQVSSHDEKKLSKLGRKLMGIDSW